MTLKIKPLIINTFTEIQLYRNKISLYATLTNSFTHIYKIYY